jgi:hypothetical protein
MSEDFVNQLTLNFLISKHQLQKLNKKVKENADTSRKTDKELYGQRITKLFNDLLVNEPPDTLLQEVQIGFDLFMDKCIYYFKAVDNNDLFEKARTDDYPSDNIIHDDIDYEKEENSIERGNYKEDGLKWSVRGFPVKEEDSEDGDSKDGDSEDGDSEDGDSEEGGVRGFPVKEGDSEELKGGIKELGSQNPVKELKGGIRGLGAQNPVEDGCIRGLPVVKHKLYKKNTSVGVDDIQKLPLDWFQNVKENYKKNQIIPRKKYITFEEQPFRDQKKKI